MPKITPAPLTRTLRAIAGEIRVWHGDHTRTVPFGAQPYLDAMAYLDTTDLGKGFGHDSGEDIVIRLLGNLQTWRGEDAQRVKLELRQALAHHQLPETQRAKADEHAPHTFLRIPRRGPGGPCGVCGQQRGAGNHTEPTPCPACRTAHAPHCDRVPGGPR